VLPGARSFTHRCARPFIDVAPRASNLFTLHQENYDADETELWRLLCVSSPRTGTHSERFTASDDYPRHDDTALSKRGEASLRAHLNKEQFFIAQLEALDASQRRQRYEAAKLGAASVL
jgi:hypothetical protein